ncbi:MAG: hypothetical protein ACPLZY_00340 [Candidatus Norongarragalinales archaeon]
MKITTKKAYPFRSFYKGKERIAFYVINILGEEPQVVIYSDLIKKANPEIDSLGVRKSEFENDEFRVREFLEKYLPKNLAEAVFKYARKDLGCKGGFSLKAYISWKEKHT